MWTYLKNQLAIRRRRQELRAIEHWIWELEDQKASAELGLKRAKLRKAQLEGQLGLLVPVDELVRLIGVT